MASKKKVKEEGGVVPVVFNVNTAYGVKDSFGYIPASFADKWVEKGVVTSTAKVVTKSAKKVTEEVVDEVDSERESSTVGFVEDSPVYDGFGESDSE